MPHDVWSYNADPNKVGHSNTEIPDIQGKGSTTGEYSLFRFYALFYVLFLLLLDTKSMFDVDYCFRNVVDDSQAHSSESSLPVDEANRLDERKVVCSLCYLPRFLVILQRYFNLRVHKIIPVL